MINTKRLLRIRADLNDGDSISTVCTRYGLSFKELCDGMPRMHNKRKMKRSKQWTGEQYIQTRDGRFYVRKTIDGVTKLYGTYASLEDAVKVRDYCILHGWKRQRIDEYCRVLGVKRCESSYGKRVRYH